MTRTSTVAGAIALLFGSGVASAFGMSTHEAAKLAVPATVAAPTTTTTTDTTMTTTTATAPIAASIVEAPKSAVALEAAPVAPKAAPRAPKPAPKTPKPAPVAPRPAPVIPVVAPPVPIDFSAAPPATTTTTVPQLVRPVCTDTSLDQKQVIPPNSSLDQIKSYVKTSAASRATMIGSYANCVAEGGAIDPRHDDINGDGDSCGGDIPTGAATFSGAITAQLDCLAELASRDDS